VSGEIVFVTHITLLVVGVAVPITLLVVGVAVHLVVSRSVKDVPDDGVVDVVCVHKSVWLLGVVSPLLYRYPRLFNPEFIA
jgi:hypothetical protein